MLFGPLKSFLLAMIVLFGVTLVAMAQTTETRDFDFAGFEKTAMRAEDVLSKGDASSKALETLRQNLASMRSNVLSEQGKYTSRVDTVRQQLDALGPSPTEGESEVQDLADRRAVLLTQLAQAQAPVIAAEEAYRRADGLIGEIDKIVRNRRKDTFLERGNSPLFPSTWKAAYTELTSYSRAVKGEVTTAFTNQTRRAEMKQNLPLIAVLLLVGSVITIWFRSWVYKGIHRLNDGGRSRAKAILNFILTVSLLIVPIMGLIMIVASVYLLEIFDVRGLYLLDGIFAAGFILSYGHWLSRQMFVADDSENALFTLEEGHESVGRYTTLVLAAILASGAVVGAVAEQAGFSADAKAALNFPLIILGGYGLYLMGVKLEKYLCAVRTDAQGTAISRRFFNLIRNICFAFGILGPIAAAVGYFEAGSILIFSSIGSLAVFGTFFILAHLLFRVTGSFEQKMPFMPGHPQQEDVGSLLQVAIGFVLILLSMPILAMLWGARWADITEVWVWLQDGVSLGDTRISIVDFFTFILIFSIGYTLTRLLQTCLRSMVLPRTRLDIGGKAAILTGTSYVGIFLAAMVAITATGLDLSNLAIVAGALSVGIGFGLQAIVSNFVSGIILLIERPIKEGDWIEVGTNVGYVQKVSVRSTTLETFDKAAVIVPNADFISGTVINRTHSSMSGRVRVPVGVAYDSDPRQVEKILLEIAQDHPLSLRDPAPTVVFMGFGPSALNFEIRAFLRDVNWMLSAHSDMNYEIVKRFGEAGIVIPFAQQDVNLRSLGPLEDLVRQALKAQKKPESGGAS